MEDQLMEWKISWLDEYLKWICGFANAQGGTLVIGKDDSGSAVGLENSQELLDVLPNKIRNSMGIVADVDTTEVEGKFVVSISVKAYPVPVSCRGRY